MKRGIRCACAVIVAAVLVAGCGSVPPAAAAVSAVWANDGGDKVTQDELRVGAPNGRKVLNRCWDGHKISVFGAKNEVVSFYLVLEAATQSATGVSVSFNTLTGPAGATIQSGAASGNDIFNWVGRPIELFYIRYLQIKGLSGLGYENYYDERHVPERLRRPWTGAGVANSGTTWQDRPDHDKFYPDIAVPLELVPTFDIAAGKNQGIWADIYIPQSSGAGLYTGQVTITEAGAAPRLIPVELQVYDFSLPDMPTARTMLFYSADNVNERQLGQSWVQGADEARAKLIQDRYFFLAHRHRISLIGDDSYISSDYTAEDHPAGFFAARLRGDFFTAANGYDGPGVNVGNNVYSVMTYGIPSSWQTASGMQTHSDGWVNWFEANAPQTEYFVYLIDESSDFAQTEQWSQWLANNPGPGRRLKSMATIAIPDAVAHVPTLQVVTSATEIGLASAWAAPADQYAHDPARRFFLYNGFRPVAGCFMTEDDGVALRMNAWIQFKHHVNRWFYWESTYYNDFQSGFGKRNVFQSAHTFGSFSKVDPVQGETGNNYSNGDGVLFYPGTEHLFPADSYGVDGPFASLRLKQWRRGLQDHDYLTLAAAVDPVAVQSLVDAMIPKVLWEVGVDDPADPTYVHANISWSTDPDVWEAARAQLAQIVAASVQMPAFTPPAGAYRGTQTVTLTCLTPGALIYYTTDSSTPTAASAQYTEPLTVSADTTLMAMAAKAGLANSAVSSASYTILWDQTITFGALANKTGGDAPFTVNATASSGLPVNFTIVSGPATVAGDTVTLTGAGTVTIRASQDGDGRYSAAPSIDRAFTVSGQAQVSQLSGSFQFGGVGKDACAAGGKLVGIPPGTVFAQKVFSLDVGGAAADFTLDSKGKGKRVENRKTTGTVALKAKLKKNPQGQYVFTGGTVAFAVTLKGTFYADWADDGVDPLTNPRKQPIPMPVHLVFDGTSYDAATPTVKLTSKAGKGGSFKK
jgi:hypothetical protein